MSGFDRALLVVALAASLMLHALLLLHSGSLAGNTERPQAKRTTTRVSFRAETAPQTPPQPPQAMPEKPPEPEVTETPEPPPEPVPPKPERQAEKARQPEPPPTPPERQPPPPPSATSSEAQKSPAATAVAGTVADPAVLEKARQEYLRRLLAHIESHKHYPRAARRRGLQGEVAVSFVLHAHGRISALQTGGAHRVLLAAADEAMASALPLPPPPAALTLPYPVSFTMRFTLR